MARQRRVEFKVSLLLPPDAIVAEAQDYVREAVEAWQGQCRPPGAYDDIEDPGDPMHALNPDSVRVTKITRPLVKPSIHARERGRRAVT